MVFVFTLLDKLGIKNFNFDNRVKVNQFVSKIGLKKKNEIVDQVKVKQLKINRDFYSAKMHFWSKFGNPNLNKWWVVTWTSSK